MPTLSTTQLLAPGNLKRRALVRGSAWVFLTMALFACGGVPKVELQADGPPVTTESGGRFEISVSLAKRPRGPVTVYAVSSDESEGRVSDPVLFEERDFSQPQTLTVTGVDDDLDDNDVAYEVTLYARTWHHGDPLRIETFKLVNRDDEVARFDALGDLPGGDEASYVGDISASGEIVVGWSSGENGDEAVRWTQQGGLHGLGGPTSRAQAVSPNGTLIAGSVAEASYEKGRAAALWRGDEAYEILEGPRQPDGHLLRFFVDGQAVLDDGRVFGTCIQYAAYGEPLACRFDGGIVDTFGPGHVFAADSAGNFAGAGQPERHSPFYTWAFYNLAHLPYPDDVQCNVNLGCLAEARDFSAAGAIVVGTSRVPDVGTDTTLFEHAFTYVQDQGALRLPDLDGGETRSGAYAISRDGRVIAGFGTDDTGQQAVVWLEGVPNRLDDLLLDADGQLPRGFHLLDVRAVSANGRAFAGNAINPNGAPEAFRVVLPSIP